MFNAYERVFINSEGTNRKKRDISAGLLLVGMRDKLKYTLYSGGPKVECNLAENFTFFRR